MFYLGLVKRAKDALFLCLSKLILLTLGFCVFFFLQNSSDTDYTIRFSAHSPATMDLVTFIREATLSLDMKGSSDTAVRLKQKEAFSMGLDLFQVLWLLCSFRAQD